MILVMAMKSGECVMELVFLMFPGRSRGMGWPISAPGLWPLSFGRSIWLAGGDITETHVKFKVPKQVPTMPSPVLVDDQLYFITDQGVTTSVNALTGEPIWTKRIAGNFAASPLFADGKLYFSNQEGKTTVIKPGREYEEIAVNALDGQLMASIAVLDQSLILRSQSHLYRIGQKPTP